MTVSDETLDRLERLEAAATPAPWFADNPDDAYCMNAYIVCTNGGADLEDKKDIVAGTLLQTPTMIGHESGKWEEDAELIAVMRNELPGLIAALRAAQANERRYLALVDTVTAVVTEDGRFILRTEVASDPIEIGDMTPEEAVSAAIDASGGNDG